MELVTKNPPAAAGDVSDAVSTPGSGKTLEEGTEPNPVFLPGESTDRGASWAVVYRVRESDTTEVTEQARTLPSPVATIHMWLLSCFHVTKVPKELIF